jgi:para-aminobenzoate synthetase component I
MRLPLSPPEIVELPPLKLPFWQYFGLFQREPYAFLLDSALESARLGQYSFLGADPFLVFQAKHRPSEKFSPTADCTALEFLGDDGERCDAPKATKKREDPLSALRQIFDFYRLDCAVHAEQEWPFVGGAVGYFGYETGHLFESLPEQGTDDLDLPDIYLMFFRSVLLHCCATGKTFLSCRALSNGDRENEVDAFIQRLQAFESREGAVPAEPPEPPSLAHPSSARQEPHPPEVLSHFDKTTYSRAVQTVKEHIAAGDVYQVCLTHRLEAPLIGGTAWDLYRELRRINPAPFASFLRFPEVEVVSSSPERFLTLDANGLAESRPMKGTRPRGKTPAEDERLCDELQSCPKDRAENVMIVDLVRNDFGRVCAYRSVQVPDFLTIEPYATVFQMVSTVQGRLAEDRDCFDLIRACFPGGSMTGAPKIEAMKIIESLEPVNRGIYSGAIGYLDFSGAMDLSMVIRTIIVKAGRCYFHVGGGIVADSDPLGEYRETMDKAGALVQAIATLKS